jgi:type V secretory pathway adhesin AidA
MSCDSRPESADTTVARAGTTTSANQAVDSPRASQEIYIDSVQAGNPLVVYGRARTFENTVQVRARDARVTARFPTSDCTTTVAFARDVPRGVAVARLVTEVLVAGPTESEKARGAASVFPAGSRVRSVVLRDGVVTADFNERLQNVGGACAAQAIRAAVTSTLRALPGVREVVITAAGNRELALQP